MAASVITPAARNARNPFIDTSPIQAVGKMIGAFCQKRNGRRNFRQFISVQSTPCGNIYVFSSAGVSGERAIFPSISAPSPLLAALRPFWVGRPIARSHRARNELRGLSPALDSGSDRNIIRTSAILPPI